MGGIRKKFGGFKVRIKMGPKAGNGVVDARTGENCFQPDPNGLHAYVVKEKEDSHYEMG